MSQFRPLLPQEEKNRQDSPKPGERRSRSSFRAERRRGQPSGLVSRQGQKKRKRGRRPGKGSMVSYLLVALAVLLVIPTLIHMNRTSRMLEETAKQKESLNTEKRALENSVAELKNQMSKVNTDEFIEKYAHEKLGMVKPNEILMKVGNSYQVDAEKAKKLEEKNASAKRSDEEASRESSSSQSEESEQSESKPVESQGQ